VPKRSNAKPQKWSNTKYLLALLGEINLATAHRALQAMHTKKRRGRKKNSELGYRVLKYRWKRFLREHPGQNYEELVPEFIRKHPKLFAVFGLKIGSGRSQQHVHKVFLQAVARGERAHEAVKSRRLAAWRIVPPLSPMGRRSLLITKEAPAEDGVLDK
jgi:hypothetical protein